MPQVSDRCGSCGLLPLNGLDNPVQNFPGAKERPAAGGDMITWDFTTRAGAAEAHVQPVVDWCLEFFTMGWD